MLAKVTPDGTTSYTWNARDKLINVVLPGGGTNAYSYYPESDLRYAMTDLSGEKQRFLYEGLNVIEELDAYNSTTAGYIEGPGIDRHIARVVDNNTFAYVTDPLGTVRNVVDSSGQVVNSYNYKAFGGARQQIASVPNPYMFTGRRLDGDTGDYYYRARYYLPGVGQFSAVDKYAPDEMTYSYAAGNPLIYVDLLGLWHTVRGTTWGNETDNRGGFVDATELGVALPKKLPKETEVRVRILGKSTIVVAPVIDTGPGNTNDPYWDEVDLSDLNEGCFDMTSEEDRNWVMDSDGRPAAEFQMKHHQYYLDKKTDAGIDLTPATWVKLGISWDTAYHVRGKPWEGQWGTNSPRWTFSHAVEWEFASHK